MVSFQSCRICLKPTDVKNLKLIFGNKGKIGNQIYLVSGVQVCFYFLKFRFFYIINLFKDYRHDLLEGSSKDL